MAEASNQPTPARCLACGGELYRRVRLDDKGHTAMDLEHSLDLESDFVSADQLSRIADSLEPRD
jgi:hypothetical protein